MKNPVFLLYTGVIALFLSLSSAGFSQNNELQKISGSWSGTLKFQGIELVLVFNFSVNDHDSLTVTIDSPDQGAKDIPTSSVVVTQDSMIVKSKTLKGSFRGAFSKDFSTATGVWKQSGMTLPTELKHSVKLFTRNRPQEPQPPYPYKEKEVVFKNSLQENSLAGTLTYPDDKGVFPAVVLITGSGPQNRDEELLGHKPFLVLADYLTRQGIAVLRYDDRGVGKSNGDFKSATTADFATDAAAAVSFLKTEEHIDTSRIGLIGHSEGGMIAPMVASEGNDIAFIVLMAGPGQTGEQILLSQAALIGRADSTPEKDIARERKLSMNIYSILRKNSDNTKAASLIRKEITSYNKKYPPEKAEDRMTDQAMELQIQTLTSPWFRYFLTFNPVTYLSKVKCPVLALNGSLDLQVPAKENLSAIEKAMIFGGNSHYTIEEIPGVNHLFQTATTGSPSEYSKIEETISPKVLQMISDWILQTTR
jgi:uncharacterized protein